MMIEELDHRIEAMTVPFTAQTKLLTTIPGIGERAAQVIISESGSRSALLRSGPLRFSWVWCSAHGWMKLGGSSADVACSWYRRVRPSD
jgi:hypothetical protein